MRCSLGRVLSRRVFSLAEFRVSVICCELCVSLESALQNILLNDCCRRAVCAFAALFSRVRFASCVEPAAMLYFAACAAGATLVACLALSRCAMLLLTIVRTFAHICGVAAVSLLDSPVPEPFCMTPRFSERFP